MVRRDASLTDQEGQRFEVKDRLMIGRARELDIVLASSRVSRHHTVLTRLPSEEVEAEDLSTTNGTLVNGERITHRLLVAGDEVEVDGNRYRFQIGPAQLEPVTPAVQRIIEAWSDDAALQVHIDALLEQGEPLGELLARGQPLPLEPELEEAVQSGALELSWRRGFIHGARFRPGSVRVWRDLLRTLLRSKSSLLLSELALPDLDPRIRLEGVFAPALTRLRLGPYFAREPATRTVAALEQAQFPGLPRLAPPEVEFITRAWLDFGADQRRELTPGRQETFATCAVRWDEERWLVAREQVTKPLTVNGVPRYDAFLVPGDVVQSGALRFTFRVS
ncbi:MAG TPA: FHA domain-containing protein [Archangium sp.]